MTGAAAQGAERPPQRKHLEAGGKHAHCSAVRSSRPVRPSFFFFHVLAHLPHARRAQAAARSMGLPHGARRACGRPPYRALRVRRSTSSPRDRTLAHRMLWVMWWSSCDSLCLALVGSGDVRLPV